MAGLEFIVEFVPSETQLAVEVLDARDVWVDCLQCLACCHNFVLFVAGRIDSLALFETHHGMLCQNVQRCIIPWLRLCAMVIAYLHKYHAANRAPREFGLEIVGLCSQSNPQR